MSEKKNTCPLSLDNNCVPVARSCGVVDVITCRRLFRAYSLGYRKATETARAKAKEKQEETPDFLNKKLHIPKT